MESKYRNYLLDLAWLLKEDASEAKKLRDAHRGQDDYAFYDGKLLAYYEVITTILSQAKAFGISPEELDLAEINPDSDLV